MGSDLYHMSMHANERRGGFYKGFKTRVCELLGMEMRFDVNGPGDDRGPTDAEVIAELKKRLGK